MTGALRWIVAGLLIPAGPVGPGSWGAGEQTEGETIGGNSA